MAGVLLFGNDSTISSVLPHHKTDAILRRENVDRYDDRDDIRTNLLDSYDRLIAFGEKHLSDPFYQEGIRRISLRSHILREVVGNLLIHREYNNPFPAKFVIEKEQIFTENGNKAHGHGPIDPRLFSPFPKNPIIARVFKEIGLADELGSGVRKLYRFCKAYSGYDPELLEGDVFRFVLPLAEKSLGETKAPVETPVETPELVLHHLATNPELTIKALAKKIGKSQRATERAIKKLREQERLRRVGPKKGGRWKILK